MVHVGASPKMAISFLLLILVVAPVLIGLIVLIIKKPKIALTILGVLVLLPVAFAILSPVLRMLMSLYGVPRVQLSLLVYPLIFALIAGFIYMLVKYPKAGLITLGVVALAVLGFVGIFMDNKVVSVSETGTHNQAVYVQTKPTATPEALIEAYDDVIESYKNADETSAVWRDGIEDEFQVDVYPSQKAAARALGKQIVELATKLNDGKEPQWFELSPIGVEDSDVFSEYSKAIEAAKSNPDNPILETAKGLEEDVARVGLVLRKFTTTSVDNIHGTILSGTLEASASIKGKKSVITFQFDEKGWLENFSAYTNSHPGRQYVVVRSKSSCTSAEWAQREAMTAACRVLASMLRDVGLHNFTVNPADVEKHGFVVDKFTQSLQGSVSNIWRQAILLDVSGDKMSQLMASKAYQLSLQSVKVAETRVAEATRRAKVMTTWARMLLSLVGLITVICVVYLIVNVATKGYYTLVLRIATAAAIIIGVIVLFMLLAMA